MRHTPFECIKTALTQLLPEDIIRILPDRWEKIGTVVTVKLPDRMKRYQEIIGKAYADVLGCATTLNDMGGIQGVYREPHVEVIYGAPKTETIHIENKIRFQLDPQKIMFSSGNMTERKRMATISNPRETVVDLFAGIGYFSIPMAVYSKPKKIYACEINPLAYQYLRSNITLNNVIDRVEPLFGDNRRTAPKDCADRVILGYLQDSKAFLSTAFDSLKNRKGILHYHDVVKTDDFPHGPLKEIDGMAKQYHRSVDFLRSSIIKSYAPGRDHVVFDVRVVE